MPKSINSANNLSTPGVYISELPTFQSSIVGVPTAVPIFIGYTETAVDPSSGKPMYLQAVSLNSLSDYHRYFGGDYDTRGVVTRVQGSDGDFQASVKIRSEHDPKTLVDQSSSFDVNTAADTINARRVAQFKLYSAMRMFFANGGDQCYMVSVNNYRGNYGGNQGALPMPDASPAPITAGDLLKGLDVAAVTKGATMLVVPDACQFPLVKGVGDDPDTCPGYSEVAVAMLKQARNLQDRMAILDLPGALDADHWTVKDLAAQAKVFYSAISPAVDAFGYGAAYAPALQSSLMTNNDIVCRNLSGSTQSIFLMNSLLTAQALSLFPGKNDADFSAQFQAIAAHIALAFPVNAADTTPFGTQPGLVGLLAAEPRSLVSLTRASPTDAAGELAGTQSLDAYLENAVPLLGTIKQILASQLNVVPPSGAMAGVWSLNDRNRGVWNAPANMSISQVVAPKVDVNDDAQGQFNLPENGNAIDILRSFNARGTVVWGARTLDGNSLDYRYIQVRRTVIYIEQSISQALQQFVFAPNNGDTWSTVTEAISSFLTGLWQAGGLMGAKASDAFKVSCGVPATMSGLDVLNGYMIVNVAVSLIHPTEFIELTFKQAMQGT